MVEYPQQWFVVNSKLNLDSIIQKAGTVKAICDCWCLSFNRGIPGLRWVCEVAAYQSDSPSLQ